MIDRVALKLEDFPGRSFDKIRRDEAAAGHVANTIIPSFYDSGRSDITHVPALMELMAGNTWIVANISVDFRAELHWPGTVEIGTAITAIGNSSVKFHQALFQNGVCASTGESVMVQLDPKTHRPTPFTAEVKAWLQRFMW